MHFDDRLATVLRLRADGAATSRIQLRQLVDLLGTAPADAHGPAIEAAYERLGDLTRTIPAPHRLAILRDGGLRLRSPRLVAALAGGEPALAELALVRAELDEEQWLDLIPALPLSVRALVRQRRDLAPRVEVLLARLGIRERGLPHPASTAEAPAAEPDPAVTAAAPLAAADAGIGALVRKIEAYRRTREAIQAGIEAPRLPLDEEHILNLPAELRAFDFATDAVGRIVWADPGAAPMAVGLLLGAHLADGAPRDSRALAELMRRHQPLRALALAIEGAPSIAGDWQVDATPRFDPLTGGFAGYRGRMRRPAAPSAAPPMPPVKDSEADRLRQALHELRTPVNAIQGFAEVIQQQLFGPTPHEYRALAAGIAGDAARMLAAFEELERLAKLDSGALELEAGMCDVAEVLDAIVAQLTAHTEARGSGFVLKVEDAPLPVPLARIEVERVIWRLLATLAGTAAPGERLRLRIRAKGGRVRINVALPAALAARSDEDLFHAAAGAVPQVIAAGVFGVGFALRLIAAEARAAGGELTRREDRLRLELPGPGQTELTAGQVGHSDMVTVSMLGTPASQT